MTYDYLIVGAGLYGSVFAHEAKKAGKKCLVIEKRKHIAGNIYTEVIEGINCHAYGPHIFHTNDEGLWNYINQFAKFNQYVYSPIANNQGRLFNLPFNMNTFYQMWGISDPVQAAAKIKSQGGLSGGIGNYKQPANLEEQAIQLVGRDIYRLLVKGYTEKQWGRDCKDIPTFIIKRLPVRFTYDNNYFNDLYQGIPVGGYTNIIKKMLQGINVMTDVDYLKNKSFFDKMAVKVVYSGPIDAYFDYKFGALEYRSLQFETEIKKQENYQGCAVMNFTDRETPYTRIIEHKHFEKAQAANTVITREYPLAWTKDKEPYYPVNSIANMRLYYQYEEMAKQETNVIFGGRLAEYRYYDMHQVIAMALKRVRKEIKTPAEAGA